MRRHVRLPLVTAAAAWVLAAGHAVGSEELLLVSGACDDLAFLNGLMFQEQGHTASGAPYYKALGASQYMYWDPNCYNGAEPTARWILDADEPSLTAPADLDQDGDCQYNARVDSGDSTHPPMHAMWHLMCGGLWRDQVLMFAQMTTTITATTTSSISSTTTSTSSSTATTTATTTTTTSATTTGTTTTSLSSTTLTTSSTTSSLTTATGTTVTATSTGTATATSTVTTTTSTGTSTETTATATQTTVTKTTSATSVTTSASGSSSTTRNATAAETTTGSSSSSISSSSSSSNISSSSSSSSSSTMRAGSPTEVPAAQANGTTTQVPAAQANATTTQVSSPSTPARNTTGTCCRCCYVGSRATCCAGRDQQDLRPGSSTTMTIPRSTTTRTGRDDDSDVADSNRDTRNNTHHGSTATTTVTGRDEEDDLKDVNSSRDGHNDTHHGANTTRTTASDRRMSAINATGVTQATSVTTTATSAKTTASATQTAAVTTTNAAVAAPGATTANATQTAAVTTTNAAVAAPVASTQPNATPLQTTATTTLSVAIASPSWYWLEEEEEVVCCEDGVSEGHGNATPTTTAPAVPDGANATEEASTTAEPGLPEASTTTVPGRPEAVQLSGVACSSKDFLNGLLFSLRGRTASGAPLYASPQGFYLYHDPDCKGAGAGTARWILDTDAPDLTRLADLDGDQDCRYLARVDSADAERPPANASWRVFCDGAWQSAELRLGEAPAEVMLPVSTSARVELSGEPSEVLALSGACELQDQLNGPLLLQGSTQSGAPYYKTLEGRFYVYLDPDCNGGPAGVPRWIIDSDAPNTSAAQDLDGDEDCKYLARTDSRSLQPPLEASWLMYCLEGWKDVPLRLEVFEGNLSATTTEQQVIAVSSAPPGPCGASRLLAAAIAGLVAALGPGRGTH